jgi:RND family efflux transporter MFP subunit
MIPNAPRWSLLISFPLLVALGCGNPPVAPAGPSVTVEKPEQKPVTDYLEVTGSVASANEVEIRARIEGFLQSIHFEEGQIVEAGDLLYIIDPREYQAYLESAQAALETARAALALAETTLLRRERALETGAVSELEVLENRAQRDVRAAKLQSAEADVRRAELDLSYTRILAPVSGKVGVTLVDPGNLVGAGEQTLLTRLVQYDPIYAYFSISERAILKLMSTPGRGESDTSRAVEVGRATDPEFPFAGTLDFVDQVVDPETGTFMIRGVFRNPEPVQLLPGLFVRGRIPLLERDGALFVSERALGSDQRGRYVMAVDENSIAQYRPVEIGALVDGMRVIEKGIGADDRIITNGVLYARPGEPVTLATDVAAAPPAASSSTD